MIVNTDPTSTWRKQSIHNNCNSPKPSKFTISQTSNKPQFHLLPNDPQTISTWFKTIQPTLHLCTNNTWFPYIPFRDNDTNTKNKTKKTKKQKQKQTTNTQNRNNAQKQSSNNKRQEKTTKDNNKLNKNKTNGSHPMVYLKGKTSNNVCNPYTELTQSNSKNSIELWYTFMTSTNKWQT